jgi:exopolyphosphatase/guanosine-5'-triphosphate,3'-diphosphate pyrophosphatase
MLHEKSYDCNFTKKVANFEKPIQNIVKLAAIDIGSNGARLLISSVLHPDTTSEQVVFKDVEYVRFPLRLGKDVFKKQKIGKKKQLQMLKLFQVFKLLMELHEVDDYMALATSAFREASNGQEVGLWLRRETGINLEIIDGAKEAEILNQIIIKELDDDKNYLHIDVGGGSTELNLYHKHQKVAARSFPVGSIREAEDSEIPRLQMKAWLQENIKKYCPNQEITAVGTGGNINKIQSMLNKEGDQLLSQTDITRILDYLNNFSFDEKINILELNPDRADTIVPATNIYLYAMECAHIDHILVPKLGLKDGMMEVMYRRGLKRELAEQANSL